MSSWEPGIIGIGPIVWVRRRNGSWWPGKILGPSELPECSLSSPKTGTPVKLLGRDDASVDWYNLEKSKRVKPFRCGEFDECIEKVESVNGMPIKKREKYARREDAILHALELEKQLMKDHLSSTVLAQSKVTTSSKKKCSNVQDGLVVRTKQACAVNIVLQDEGRTGSALKHGSSNGEHSVATPRMRGLRDSSPRAVNPKRKMNSINGDDQVESELAPKRSRRLNGLCSSGVLEEKEQSYDKGREEYSSSGVVDDEDEDSECSQSESDSSQTEPDDSFSISSSDLEANGLKTNETHSTSLEEQDDSFFSGDVSHFYPDDPYLNEAVPNWQRNWKRNTCFGLKEPINGKLANGTRPSDFSYPSNFVRRDRALIDWDEEKWNLVNGRCLSSMRNLLGKGRALLVDVELKVQSTYKRECVPIISLVSKVNGMAIVGYSMKTEPIEEGCYEGILGNEIIHTDTPKLPPAWKTARRRNFRNPRPIASCDSLPPKKNVVQSSSFLRKASSRSPRSSVDKKPFKRASKKVSFSSVQKTKALSSIGAKSMHGTPNFEAKRDVKMAHTVACIPVKLVFSRLLEKINRPPVKALGVDRDESR